MIRLLLAMLCVCFSSAKAQVDAAETAYRTQDYASARSAYERVLDDGGIDRASVLLNLGCCAYRMGEFADALVYFSRARRYAPDDPDLQTNLQLTQRELGIPASRIARNPSDSLGLISGVSKNAILLLALAAEILAIILFRSFRQRLWPRRLAYGCVLLTLSLAALLVVQHSIKSALMAITTERRCSVHAEPHKEQAALFELKLGERVIVLESSDRWTRIRHARGRGWVPRNSLGILLD